MKFDNFDFFYLSNLVSIFNLIPIVPTCPPLTAPANGGVDCSLGSDGQANPGETCTFTCDDGYQISGNIRRTCEDDGNWSGMVTTCVEGMVLPKCNFALAYEYISICSRDVAPNFFMAG